MIKMVADLQFDRKGVLWMAVTGEGVFSYDFKSDKLTNYRHKTDLPNSLSNNNVNSIAEDSQGNLWFSTSGSGLDLYRRETNDFDNFDSHKNGLSSDCIYEVFESTTKGRLLMITNQGFSVFDYTRKTVQNYGKENGFPLTATNENALYMTQDGEVFSQDWNRTRGQRSITYTNLNPGSYKLVIQSSDDNQFIERSVLKITILPPFYKTTLAYLIYILVIGALLWYLIVTYNSRIRLRESLKYEQKHLKDIEALNQSKLRFFTNISHEFRTPLTLIVGQVESLLQLQSFTPVVYNKVLGIYKNSLQLKELITELLDFRKQEQGHMKIKVGPHNLVEFLYEN